MTKTSCIIAALLVIASFVGCGDDSSGPAAKPAKAVPPVATTAAPRPSDGTPRHTTIEIYVTPYYNSKGPQVAVGAFSDQLAHANGSTIVDVAKAMKEKWDTLPIEAMFVLSIRLYDLGHKDDSVFWFHSASYRGRLLASVIDPGSVGSIGSPAFELNAALASFHELAGEYINGYAFGELPKTRATLVLVRSENQKLPSFAKTYPNLRFIPADRWPAAVAGPTGVVDQLIKLIDNDADKIRAERKNNGVEGKY